MDAARANNGILAGLVAMCRQLYGEIKLIATSPRWTGRKRARGRAHTSRVEGDEDKVGKLDFSLYGTRDAAQNWAQCYIEVLCKAI